uniref:Uncharacterized protein n=1 Tax=Siphoviridae sp. ctKy93 TaxID=2827569 RepID=A0A8S5RRE2_9CAUD|nr:MAG TPA: hypothetical protein [Siphoviridae sp. ctKy93]
MDTNNEILDAIEILADKKISENITKVLTGICKFVNINNNTCVMDSNGVISTVQFYGSPPEVNELYRIFVPSNNMSRSFIVVPPKFTVNPNLLDNWYFGNPVNQRGLTEYAISWNQYSVDRWSCEGDTVYVRIEQDGIVLKNNNSNGFQFKQILPDGLIPVGSAVTMSVLCTSVSGICHLTYAQINEPYSGSIPWTRVEAGVVTTAHGVQIGGQHKIIIGLEPGAEIKILAIKLELGSQQTLAHLENGSLVLNEIPDFGEQLRKCQRYFVRYAFNTQRFIGVLNIDNASGGQGYINLPVPMRATPTISGPIGFYSTDNNVTVNINILGSKGGLIWVNASPVASLTNAPKTGLLYAQTTLDISADL